MTRPTRSRKSCQAAASPSEYDSTGVDDGVLDSTVMTHPPWGPALCSGRTTKDVTPLQPAPSPLRQDAVSCGWADLSRPAQRLLPRIASRLKRPAPVTNRTSDPPM